MARKTAGARLDDAIRAFLTTREQHVAHRTWLGDKYALAAVRRHAGANCWVSQLDDEFWWDYFYGEEGRKDQVGAAYFNKDRQRIKAFVDFCVDRGWTDSSVLRYLDKYVKPRKEHLSQHLILTPAQLLQLTESAAYPSHRVALAVGCNTALRGSEIVGIKLGRINLEAGEMLVTLWKNSRDEVVPITSRLDHEIRQWLTVYEKTTIEQGLGPLQPDWHLVPAQWPGLDREPGSVSYTSSSPRVNRLRPERCPGRPHEIVTLAMDRMGVAYEPGEGFHTTRRAFARAFHDGLVAQGDPNALRKTAALLHHANTTMTERYLRLNVETVAVSQALKGQDFLGNLVAGSNVVPLRREA
jgi:integrase